MRHLLIIASLVCISLTANAQVEEKKLTITDLNWLDKQHLSKQVEAIDEIARSNFGSQITGTPNDLVILQRIIYRGLIAKDDHLTLQALGAVLGNVLNGELGLNWQNYEDLHGKSRAICAPDTQECVFPITMLSRRMAVGLLPDVEVIYQDSIAALAPFLAKSPYDDF